MAGCGQPSADCRASLERLLFLRLLRPFGARNDRIMDSRFRGNDKKRSNKLVNAPPIFVNNWGKDNVE